MMGPTGRAYYNPALAEWYNMVKGDSRWLKIGQSLWWVDGEWVHNTFRRV